MDYTKEKCVNECGINEIPKIDNNILTCKNLTSADIISDLSSVQNIIIYELNF